MLRISPTNAIPVGMWDPAAAHDAAPLTFDPAHGLSANGERAGGCIQCADAPCTRFTAAEIAVDVGVDLSCATDTAVCPVDAITIGPTAAPVINADSCIACGLCIARCPVGALSLSDADRPEVRILDESSRVPFAGTLASFQAARSYVADAIARVHAEQDHLLAAAEGATAHLSDTSPRSGARPDARRAIGRLVRNTFLALGLPARLSISGNNSDPCEFVALLPGGLHLVGEIESGRDGLDATRRAIAARAVLEARWGLTPNSLRPVVVIARVPNLRTDVYRLLDDVHAVLGLDVALVPVASLVAAIYAMDRDAVIRLFTTADVMPSVDQPSHAFVAAFGDALADALARAGIAPRK